MYISSWACATGRACTHFSWACTHLQLSICTFPIPLKSEKMWLCQGPSPVRKVINVTMPLLDYTMWHFILKFPFERFKIWIFSLSAWCFISRALTNLYPCAHMCRWFWGAGERSIKFFETNYPKGVWAGNEGMHTSDNESMHLFKHSRANEVTDILVHMRPGKYAGTPHQKIKKKFRTSKLCVN